MKYAVVGAAGQLGRDLCQRLAGEVVPLGRPHFDITKPDEIDRSLTELRPDVVVNCAAYNLVDRAEAEPDQAFAVNAWGVRSLARSCQRLGIALMHFSSDFVYGVDAKRVKPYSPTDCPGPLSVYGMSKLCGEYAVQSECERHYILRTCGLYGVWGSGGKGTNFVETMLRLAGQQKPLKVVADQVCTPSYTVDVATVAIALLQTNRYGLYHATNDGYTSWHDFAAAIFELSGISADLQPTTSAEFGAAARRPPYSVLDCKSLSSVGIPPMRHWRRALETYLNERRAKK